MRLLSPSGWYHFARAFTSDVSPERIAAGITLGIFAGLTPPFTLQWGGLLGLVLFLRVNFIATLCCWMLTFLLAPLLDPLMSAVGTYVLTEIPALHPLWARSFHSLILPFTGFNNSVVMGSLALCLVFCFPCYWIARLIVIRTEADIHQALSHLRWWQKLSNSGYFTQDRGLFGLRYYFRFAAVVPASILFLSLWVYFVFIFDAHVKSVIQNVASSLHGARVDIGRVRTNFIKSTFELNQIEIASRNILDKNLFSVEKLRFHVDPWAVLRKKLFITDMSIEGVRYLSPRQISGALPPHVMRLEGVANLFERMASGLFSSIRNNLQNNPLFHLDQFSHGIDLTKTVQVLSNQLPSLKRIDESWQILDRTARSWEKLYPSVAEQGELARWKTVLIPKGPDGNSGRTIATLSETQKAQQELEAYRKMLESRFQTIQTESEHLEKYLKSLTSASEIGRDIALVQEKIGLPRLDFKDLTPLLLGNKLISYFEKMAYWVGWSRRRMPRGTERIVAQPKERGISYHFGKEAAFPAFFLMHASLSSDLAHETHGGKIYAVVEGLTTDPSLWGRPLTIRFNADFPSQGIEGVKGEIVVDHTGNEYREKFKIQVAQFPLNHYPFTDMGTLRVGLEKANLSLDFDAEFADETLTSKWQANFTGSDYLVQCKYNKLEKLIRETLSPIYNFTLNGKIEGSLDNPTLSLSSELGQQLASRLVAEFRHEIGAIEDNVKQILLDRIEPQTRRVQDRFEEMRTKAVNILQSELRLIEDLKHRTTKNERQTRLFSPERP